MATWTVKVDEKTGVIQSVNPPSPLRIAIPRGDLNLVNFSIEYFGVKLFNAPRVHIDSRDVGQDFRVETDGRQISHFTMDITGYSGTQVWEVTQLAQPSLIPNPLQLKLVIGETVEPYTPAEYVVTDRRPILHVLPNQSGVIDVIIEHVYYGDDRAELSFGVFQAKGNDPEVPETSHAILSGGTVVRLKHAELSPEKNYKLSVVKNNVSRWYTISTKADPHKETCSA